MEKIVNDGYIKMLALDIGHLETRIIMEKNTNFQNEVDEFRKKYENLSNSIVMMIHMPMYNNLMFSDYQKVVKHIHPGDYVRDLVINKHGHLMDRKYLIDNPDIKYTDIDRFGTMEPT